MALHGQLLRTGRPRGQRTGLDPHLVLRPGSRHRPVALVPKAIGKMLVKRAAAGAVDRSRIGERQEHGRFVLPGTEAGLLNGGADSDQGARHGGKVSDTKSQWPTARAWMLKLP